MTDTAVTTEVHQTLNIHRNLATQIAFYNELRYCGTQVCNLRLSQFFYLGVRGYTGGLTDLASAVSVTVFQ